MADKKRAIVKIDFNNKVYGGRIYENEVVSLLSDEFDFKRIYIRKNKSLLLDIVNLIGIIIKYKFFFKGTLLLTNSTSFLAGMLSNNIVVIHHIETNSHSRGIRARLQAMCDTYFLRNKSKFNKIVVVSKYWFNRLKSLGCSNLNLIYNSFEPAEYQAATEDIHRFREKYGFTGKPLIYLGSCRKGKGVIESYEALKDLDAYFVTSGDPHVELPVPNLNLSFKEYKLLLASADIVIAMSLFEEGWNRVVHEASLSGTIVIGNNPAGMGELMELSKQVVVTNFDNLKNAVLKMIDTSYSPPKDLLKLDKNYFKKSWREILK